MIESWRRHYNTCAPYPWLSTTAPIFYQPPLLCALSLHPRSPPTKVVVSRASRRRYTAAAISNLPMILTAGSAWRLRARPDVARHPHGAGGSRQKTHRAQGSAHAAVQIPQIAVDPACDFISHTLYQRQIDFCNKTCSGPDSCSAEKEPVKFERRFCYLAVRKRDDRQ